MKYGSEMTRACVRTRARAGSMSVSVNVCGRDYAVGSDLSYYFSLLAGRRSLTRPLRHVGWKEGGDQLGI